MLSALVERLQQTVGILHKRDIQTAARALAQLPQAGLGAARLGDDCAAIPDGTDYLLLAAEGMMPFFVEQDPWFAGWSAVMVNISDIYAMGGRPIAIVDVLWSPSGEQAQPLWAGMQAAATAYRVPIVGGHTNCHSPYGALAVAILGRAKHLITSFAAQPGDQLIMVVNLEGGQMHPRYAFWNAATQTSPEKLRSDLELLPSLAEAGLCSAGKDISMGGVIGTALMLLETSHCGALIDLDAIPRPLSVPLETWLTAFPSYGFLLSVAPNCVTPVCDLFGEQQLICQVIGEVNSSCQLVLQSQQDALLFWDLKQQPLTGFA